MPQPHSSKSSVIQDAIQLVMLDLHTHQTSPITAPPSGVAPRSCWRYGLLVLKKLLSSSRKRLDLAPFIVSEQRLADVMARLKLRQWGGKGISGIKLKQQRARTATAPVQRLYAPAEKLLVLQSLTRNQSTGGLETQARPLLKSQSQRNLPQTFFT